MTDHELLVKKFLHGFGEHHFIRLVFDQVIHQNQTVDKAVEKYWDNEDLNLYFRIKGINKEDWFAARRKEIADHFAGEQARREAAEAARLTLATNLSKVHWQLLSWKTLTEVNQLVTREQPKPPPPPKPKEEGCPLPPLPPT